MAVDMRRHGVLNLSFMLDTKKKETVMKLRAATLLSKYPWQGQPELRQQPLYCNSMRQFMHSDLAFWFY